MVFDVSSEESFDNVQHWMRTVQEVDKILIITLPSWM